MSLSHWSGRLRRRRLRDLPAIEFVATVTVVVLSIALIAVVIGRLVHASDDRTADLVPNEPAHARLEVPLGDFQYMMPLSAGGAMPNSTALRFMEFTAAAVVRGTGSEIGSLEAVVASCKYRIRETIDRTARVATREELADPDLAVIRGRLRGQINDLLGRPIIDDVVFSNFRGFDVVDAE